MTTRYLARWLQGGGVTPWTSSMNERARSGHHPRVFSTKAEDREVPQMRTSVCRIGGIFTKLMLALRPMKPRASSMASLSVSVRSQPMMAGT